MNEELTTHFHHLFNALLMFKELEEEVQRCASASHHKNLHSVTDTVMLPNDVITEPNGVGDGESRDTREEGEG